MGSLLCAKTLHVMRLSRSATIALVLFARPSSPFQAKPVLDEDDYYDDAPSYVVHDDTPRRGAAPLPPCSSKLPDCARYPSAYPADYVKFDARAKEVRAREAAEKVVTPAGYSHRTYCTACCLVAYNFREALMPKLRNATAKAKLQRNPDERFGELDEIATDTVDMVCTYDNIHHKFDVRKACRHIITEHAEELVDATVAQSYRPPEEDEELLLPTVCRTVTRACATDELFWYKPEIKQRLLSERPPEGNQDKKVIFGAVGSTWVDAIGAASGAPAGAQRAGSSALEKDVLFYMYYPYSKRNAVLRPRFDKLAELLWKPKCCGSRPSTLRVGQINAKANELPAPYGLHILKDELVLYPAGAKESPAHLQWDDTEQTPPLLMEMLELLRDQSQNKETSEFVNNIMSHIGEIRLYDPDWYKLPVAKLVEEEEGSEVSELMRQHADENKRLGRAKKTTEQKLAEWRASRYVRSTNEYDEL